ncbi:MAG: hypothetical protein KL863_16625 [Rhizobium sp.]|nr:hypothetical protein [Rhizobium sp.]
MKDRRTKFGESEVVSRRIDGTDGPDVFHGSFGGDLCFGHGGADVVFGNEGSDRISGGRGADIIYGDRGKDRIIGGPGNDTIEGGMHKDIMSGGPGADMFRFLALPSYVNGSNLDIITDFQPRKPGEYVSIFIEPELDITEFSQLRDMMFQDGKDVVLSFGGVDILVLENVSIRQLSADDFFIESIGAAGPHLL